MSTSAISEITSGLSNLESPLSFALDLTEAIYAMAAHGGIDENMRLSTICTLVVYAQQEIEKAQKLQDTVWRQALAERDAQAGAQTV